MNENFLRKPLHGGAFGPRILEEKPLQDADTHRATVEQSLSRQTPRLFEGIASQQPAKRNYTGDEKPED